MNESVGLVECKDLKSLPPRPLHVRESEAAREWGAGGAAGCAQPRRCAQRGVAVGGRGRSAGLKEECVPSSGRSRNPSRRVWLQRPGRTEGPGRGSRRHP